MVIPRELVCKNCGATAPVVVCLPVYDETKAPSSDDSQMPIAFRCVINCANCGKQFQTVSASAK